MYICYFIVTGELDTIMVDKTILLEAGYEIPEKNIDAFQVQLRGNEVDDKEWSDTITRFLLDKYSIYLELVGPMKKFKNKKAMWLQIAEDLEEKLGIRKTYVQCENRYKTILKRKCTCEKNNSASGSKRVKVNFEDEIRKIATIDDSVDPEILQSANKVKINIKNNESIIKKERKRHLNVRDTLLWIHKEKEAKKQARHEEKMTLLKRFLEKQNNT